MNRALSALLLSVALVPAAHAALSKEYANFPKGPAQHLLTQQEREQWKSVGTNAEAKQFIDLFFARRDPTPSTPANEFRVAFDERVKVADEKFHSARAVGSLTDQGKAFILLGSPTRVHRSDNAPRSTHQSVGSAQMQTYSPRELWRYEEGRTPLDLGQPLVEVAFVDQYGTGDWKMERTAKTDYETFFERVARSYVTQPDLRTLPTYAATTAPAAAVAAPVATLKSEALRNAVSSAAAASNAGPLYVTYGEFITPAGEAFVPVQLYAAKQAGLSAGAKVTFFGEVRSESGTSVAAFEEPATLIASNDAQFVDRTLRLPPGRYTGKFGLAKDGTPVSIVTAPIEVRGLQKDAASVSDLILSNHVYTLSEAQKPTDPFAFGGMKVVPKSDGVFRKTDELWYFFEVRNPGLDPATAKPKLSLKVTFSGTAADGKPLKLTVPPEVTAGHELKGMPGRYAIGRAWPLTKFAPGSYTVAVKLTDATSEQSWAMERSFRVVE